MPEQKLSPEMVRRLYDRHGPALVVYARPYVPDSAVAEDVVHQVFLKLLVAEIRVPDSPVAYLYRAVRNAALNASRNGRRNVAIDAEKPVFAHRGGDQDAALALDRALGELPEEQREIVILRVWSGLTLEEAAVSVGVPLNTAASRYRYALEKLREKLRAPNKA